MNRRNFIKTTGAASAALLLPSWLMPKPIQRIDLTPFCDDKFGSSRYHMTQPFAQGEMIYATDARICVRTTLAVADELGDEVRLPPVWNIPYWTMERSPWRTFPAERLSKHFDLEEDTCPRCYGFGGLGQRVECGACLGTGDVYAENELAYYEYNCPKTYRCKACRGSGSITAVPCDYCDGTGGTCRPSVQHIDDVILAGHYASKIRTLPGVEYATVLQHREIMLLLRFDGGEGVVLGMHHPGVPI